MDTEYVRSRFIKHFDGTTGFLYASPGRINLIGEHTDYNGGFVFPGAVDKGMIAEIKPENRWSRYICNNRHYKYASARSLYRTNIPHHFSE